MPRNHLETQQDHRRFLRPGQAAERLGISESSFWRLAKNDPTFPTPRKLGGKTTVVEIAALDGWADAKLALAEA